MANHLLFALALLGMFHAGGELALAQCRGHGGGTSTGGGTVAGTSSGSVIVQGRSALNSGSSLASAQLAMQQAMLQQAYLQAWQDQLAAHQKERAERRERRIAMLRESREQQVAQLEKRRAEARQALALRRMKASLAAQ